MNQSKFNVTYEELDMIVNLAEARISLEKESPENHYYRLKYALNNNVAEMRQECNAPADRRLRPTLILNEFIEIEHSIVEGWNLFRLGGVVPRFFEADVPELLENFPIRDAATDLSKHEGFRFQVPDFPFRFRTDRNALPNLQYGASVGKVDERVDPTVRSKASMVSWPVSVDQMSRNTLTATKAPSTRMAPSAWKSQNERNPPAIHKAKALQNENTDLESSEDEDPSFLGSKRVDAFARNTANAGTNRRSGRARKSTYTTLDDGTLLGDEAMVSSKSSYSSKASDGEAIPEANLYADENESSAAELTSTVTGPDDNAENAQPNAKQADDGKFGLANAQGGAPMGTNLQLDAEQADDNASVVSELTDVPDLSGDDGEDQAHLDAPKAQNIQRADDEESVLSDLTDVPEMSDDDKEQSARAGVINAKASGENVDDDESDSESDSDSDSHSDTDSDSDTECSNEPDTASERSYISEEDNDSTGDFSDSSGGYSDDEDVQQPPQKKQRG
jgi:hypothetical protein